MAHKKGIDILKGRMKSKDDIKKESLKQMMNRLDSYNLPHLKIYRRNKTINLNGTYTSKSR